MAINKYFHSDMRGAPQLAGNAPGSLASIIRACLGSSGFGSAAITNVSVASGVATATVATGTPYEVGSVIRVAGATPAGLNGDFRVTKSTSTTVSWATSVADMSTAASAGTVKVAPMDWAIPFSDGNKVIVKPSAPQASGGSLWLDASNGLAARVRGFESVSAIDTGTGPFPTDAQQSGGGYWPCSVSASASSIPWEVYASDTGFHLVMAPQVAQWSYAAGRTSWWFGDMRPLNSTDAWCCSLLAGSEANDAYGTNYRSVNSRSRAVYIARSYTGIAGAARGGRFSPLLAPASSSTPDGSFSGADAHGGASPNRADNSLLLSPLIITEGAPSNTQCVRGRLPGIFHSSQLIAPGTFAPRARVLGTGEFAGRTLLASPGNTVQNGADLGSLDGAVFFDISDVWL